VLSSKGFWVTEVHDVPPFVERPIPPLSPTTTKTEFPKARPFTTELPNELFPVDDHDVPLFDRTNLPLLSPAI
jgi:hypothetical protein